MRKSIENDELDFRFSVRHGCTHAELEIKTASVKSVDQIVFGFIVAMQEMLAHRLLVKPVHSKL